MDYNSKKNARMKRSSILREKRQRAQEQEMSTKQPRTPFRDVTNGKILQQSKYYLITSIIDI